LNITQNTSCGHIKGERERYRQTLVGTPPHEDATPYPRFGAGLELADRGGVDGEVKVTSFDG
jgi:hypothetical protein